jgi:hypothetical protein
MDRLKRCALTSLVVLAITCSLAAVVAAQDRGVVLTPTELTRVVPPGFYFQGQTAATQMRNSAAARFGTNRYVIAGLVDTSGYSSEVRAKYEGFLITDSAIRIGASDLGVGAYGFGFTNDGKLNVLDLAGNEVISISTKNEKGLRRPRPLMMSKNGDEIRLYSGRNYVVIAAR